ncbi:MAG TPA: hypothetical protein DCZ05_08160 [Deltaproteobacteria bacterium]|nr:hypothetical protein [Deltaproteobacteria bacterium]
MKKICQILVGLVVLWGGAVAGAVDAPQYNEGDQWVIQYKRSSSISRSDAWLPGIYCIVYRNGEFLWYTEACGASESIFTGLTNDVPIFYGRYLAGKDEMPYLAFPLETGSKREYRYFNPRSGGRGGENISGVIAVEKTEQAVVKAGTLNAYKHVLEEGTGRSWRSYTYYYAPACKCVAKLATEFAIGTTHAVELLNYSVK